MFERIFEIPNPVVKIAQLTSSSSNFVAQQMLYSRSTFGNLSRARYC
ncbi:hypothetical protein ACHAXM_000102, partial [Skeletonema potamos]